MTDLRSLHPRADGQMERDLGTRLDWVAVDHWNTDNPHVHILVRGVADDGADLVISRDYISRGLRPRAEDLVTLELGPKPRARDPLGPGEGGRRGALDPSRLEIRGSADETAAVIDLRPGKPAQTIPRSRRLMIGRAAEAGTDGSC